MVSEIQNEDAGGRAAPVHPVVNQSLYLNIVWEDEETKALAKIFGRLTKPAGTPAQEGEAPPEPGLPA
jgi:hypothetical protein